MNQERDEDDNESEVLDTEDEASGADISLPLQYPWCEFDLAKNCTDQLVKCLDRRAEVMERSSEASAREAPSVKETAHLNDGIRISGSLASS